MCKNRFLRSSGICPKLGIQLGFSLWHFAETVFELPMFADSFYANCHNFITLHFSETEFWQIAENGTPHTTNINFYVGLLQKFMYDLSLGLNYCSIGTSPPPSSDTVPLKFLADTTAIWQIQYNS
jgi:hypothetical protein